MTTLTAHDDPISLQRYPVRYDVEVNGQRSDARHLARWLAHHGTVPHARRALGDEEMAPILRRGGQRRFEVIQLSGQTTRIVVPASLPTHELYAAVADKLRVPARHLVIITRNRTLPRSREGVRLDGLPSTAGALPSGTLHVVWLLGPSSTTFASATRSGRRYTPHGL